MENSKRFNMLSDIDKLINLLNQASVAPYVFKEVSGQIYVHPGWNELFRVDSEGPFDFHQTVSAENKARLRQFLEASASLDHDLEAKTSQECLFRLQDVPPQWIYLKAAPIQVEETKGLLYQAINLPLFNEHCSQLFNQHELLLNFLNVAPMSVCIRDAEGRYLMANRLHCIEINTTETDICGRSYQELAEGSDPGLIQQEKARDAWIFENHIPLATEDEVQFEDLYEPTEENRSF